MGGATPRPSADASFDFQRMHISKQYLETTLVVFHVDVGAQELVPDSVVDIFVAE
jgi:hypothetical protein